MPPDRDRKPRVQDEMIDWFTVSYKTIYTAVGIVLLAAGGVAYYYFGWNTPPTPPSTVLPGPTVTTARFTSIEGSVKVKPVGQFEWLAADRNMALKKGDLVRTGSGSTAEITFFDGTVVHVRPESLITIEETSEDPATKERKVAWHISSGEVNFQTARRNVQGSSTEVSTPTLTVRQTEMAVGGVRVAETGDSDVKIYRGTSRVETKAGQKVDLASNEALKVDASGKAGSKVVLPEIPTLLAPQHGAEITYPNPSNSTTLLLWKDVPGALAYHVMVDFSPYFNRPIVDSVHKATQAQLRGLEGKYYWRVAAVDRDNVEGSFSEFAKFAVARRTGPSGGEGPPPPLEIESLDVRTNILQIKGKTEPGASVTVNGQRVDVQTDGTFNEFINLEKIGRQDVKIVATGINGGKRELTRPVVVAY